MADLTSVMVVANLLVGIVGFTLLGEVVRRLHQQIGALKGTVDAQKQTLDTVGELNKVALEMARAFDPKKYADAVNTYQELIEKKANATVEDARRAFEQENAKTREEAARLAGNYNATIHMGLGLLPYIPSAIRVAAIASVRVPEPYERGIKGWFSAAAKDAPDLSVELSGAYRALIGAALRVEVKGTGTVTDPVVPPPNAGSMPPLPTPPQS